MPKSYELVLHSQGEQNKFPAEADLTYARLKVPELGRHSTLDALVLRQVQLFWTRETQMGRLPKIEDHAEALLYLQSVAAAYRAWNQFKAEYAEVVAQSLPKEETKGSLAASVVETKKEDDNREIFKQMQRDGIFVGGLNAKEEASLISNITMQRKQLKKDLTDKAATQTYGDYIFDESYATTKVGKAFAAYLNRLEVAPSNNKQAPETYLMRNFNQALDRDSLLYVRACEELGCSLNPEGSDCARGIVENLVTQVIKNVNAKCKDKEATVFYGSFASGLLLRDLVVLERLIESGYKKFELVFVDLAYENLIKQVGDFAPKSLAEQVSIDMQMKAINEFSNWLATHVDCDKDNPLKIHFFSKVAEAEDFFKTVPNKMDVLVAQDYFTSQGARDFKAATPTAHGDFMRLAAAGLKDQGCFYELVKDDTKSQIYLHAGIINAGGRYTPYFTNVHELTKPLTKTYTFTSLGFFTGDRDNPESCAQGALCTTHDHKPNFKSS